MVVLKTVASSGFAEAAFRDFRNFRNSKIVRKNQRDFSKSPAARNFSEFLGISGISGIRGKTDATRPTTTSKGKKACKKAEAVFKKHGLASSNTHELDPKCDVFVHVSVEQRVKTGQVGKTSYLGAGDTPAPR